MGGIATRFVDLGHNKRPFLPFSPVQRVRFRGQGFSLDLPPLLRGWAFEESFHVSSDDGPSCVQGTHKSKPQHGWAIIAEGTGRRRGCHNQCGMQAEKKQQTLILSRTQIKFSAPSSAVRHRVCASTVTCLASKICASGLPASVAGPWDAVLARRSLFICRPHARFPSSTNASHKKKSRKRAPSEHGNGHVGHDARSRALIPLSVPLCFLFVPFFCVIFVTAKVVPEIVPPFTFCLCVCSISHVDFCLKPHVVSTMKVYILTQSLSVPQS